MTNSGDTYADAILRTLSSFGHPHAIVNSLVNNGSSDNPVSLASPSSFSSPSSSSSLFSSSTSITLDTSADCYTLEAHLPLVKTNIEHLEKFQRLLTRLDTIYNRSSSMSMTTLPPPAAPHMNDRYLFRSLSNDNNPARMSWSKKNKAPHANGSNDTPPGQRKRYKFASPTNADQNVNTSLYKFPNGQTEMRSHSTDSSRYYFPPDDSTKKTMTFMRSGNDPEPRLVTFIGGATSKKNEKDLSTPSNSITLDGPYLFSKTPDSASEGPRKSSSSPERRSLTRPSPTRIDTVTSTNGSLSTIRRSPPNKAQNVRFDPSTTPRSYLNEARERLAGKKRGQSPRALQESVDRLVSSTNQKYRQQQIVSPPLRFQQPSNDYRSQYYANEDEPAVDYPMDSDDEEANGYAKPSTLYNPTGNRTHDKIMKNVNQSLIDRRYLSETNRLKRLDQHVRSYIRSLENQALQREYTHNLIRCFSSTYLEDLRREENRHAQTQINPRSYTFEDVQDIHMPNILETYRTRHAIDRERRLRLTNSVDGAITASTPTSSIGAGQFSPLLSLSSPIMTGSLTENTDAQSGGFEIDRRGTKSQSSTTVTPTNLRTGHMPPAPGLDPFYGIMQERLRVVDASIAGQVSKASQMAQRKDHQDSPLISPRRTIDHDSDSDTRSNSSFWLEDEEDGQQMITDQRDRSPQHQRQISRYLSTVNRSLLDRPSDLVADFYISKLNRSMQESIRHVENIARDKAQSRQIRNREFMEEPTNKLGRSLSAEHLYQVRKEHFRYRQPVNAPTSFTAEDVADIYKPFALENFKRKIAIEFERRRRAREGQLLGTTSPMYGSHTDVGPLIRTTQPPLLEIPIIPVVDRQAHLSRTPILRQNEPGYSSSSGNVIFVPSPVVAPTKIPIGRARRTLTDDGSADVVHHIGKVSPPPSVLIDQPASPRIRTSIIVQEQGPRVSTISPPDFAQRESSVVRQERAKTQVTELPSDELIDGALTSSQTTLFKDNEDYDTNLRKPVQIITSIEATTSPSARRPKAKIYTHSLAGEPVRFCHADLIESDSGNYDLSMANIRSVLTLNHGEVKELNLVAHQAQRLQLPAQDYDRAMIVLSPEQVQQQHQFDRQPLLLAAATVKQLHDEPIEQVSRHIEQQQPTRQHTMLITPVAEHMAKVEQDISVFENISSTHLSPAQRSQLREMPVDPNLLLSPLSAEQPMILRSSKINRVESLRESPVGQVPENDYYRRRIRALDLLRNVDNEFNQQSVEQSQVQILENAATLPPTTISPDRTKIVTDQLLRERQTIEHIDEPVIYESIDQTVLHRLPRTEHVSSSEVDDDQLSIHRIRENSINIYQTPPRRSQEHRLNEFRQESVTSLHVDPADQTVQLRSREEGQRNLEPPKRPEKKLIFSYGQTNEIPLSRSSSFGSDQELKNHSRNSARIEYDRRTLSSLDDISQPISHHPPTRTHRDQEHIAQEIEREPMALREETALENEVSYDGSLGRASLNRPIQSFNAPREEYIHHHHHPHETSVVTADPSIETTSFIPADEQHRQQARTRQESDHFESLAEQHYVEINIATPTPSMRRVHPAPYSRPGTFFEDITMERTVNANLGTTKIEHANVDQVHEHDSREYIATSSRDHSEHLPVQQLPIQHLPSAERARVIPSPDQSKSDEVLILDRVIQHISEDEKSTSSEEVIFEEWSEEFPCERIEEVDRRTNRVLRSEINQIGERIKSDVIKEEYKEKNERIKGHKSYDIVKEVYRRVPAHTVDRSKHTVIPIDRPKDHVYEEIPPAVVPRDRKWSSEDIYTTEIVYDSDAVREYQQIDRNKNNDISTPPSSSRTYDRVRPGQYPPIPPTTQATISTVPSSNYDRISSIVTPPSHYTDERRPSEREEVVSEEYTVEVEHRRSPTVIHQTSKYVGKQKEETSEEENSDAYVITSGRDNTYEGLSTIIDQAGRRSSGARASDWRNELKQAYARTSLDDDRFDQFGKETNGNYVAQRVSIVPSSSSSQRFKEVQIKVPTREKTSSATDPILSQGSPSTTRHAVKEVLVCVTRGQSPEKHMQQQIYQIHSPSSSAAASDDDDENYDENEQNRQPFIRAISIRSRDTTKKSPVVTPTQDDRPVPPKRSSSSSIIDERRALFEQYQQQDKDRTSPMASDQPVSGRVGELKTAFESSTNGANRDDLNRIRPFIPTSLTEERRRLFEQQQQQQQQDTSTPRRTATEYQLDERRMSETHTGPSRLPDRAEQSPSPPDMKSTTRVQSTDRLGRTGFDKIKSSLESSITKTTTTEPQTSVDITIKSKQVISSVDSDVSGQSPPIHQSTPKSTKQINDDDAGHESEDELSDPMSNVRKQEQQQQDIRRKTRLRDFSQSTAQPIDSSYSSQRTRSTFNEENMENLLSHVPASKGKALLIELSPRPSHESPIASSKPARDPYKSLVSSDSGVFDYSTATSHHPTMSSSSWRNQGSSTIIDEANRTSTVIRDSGAYADSPTTTPSISTRYGRRQTSDTDQTTIHGGDDSVSRPTYKYETEIVSNEPSTSRHVRRQITRSPPSDYENIANFHSGMNSQRKVPITTQSRSLISTKPLVIDEYETIETETRVECQVQRTHEIKESTTRTEGTGSPHTPKKVVTTTTTTTTTTRSPESSSDEAIRTTTPARRVLLNERPHYQENNRANGSPIFVQKPHVGTREVRPEARFDSPPSDSLSYPTTFPTTTMPEEDSIRVEETLFKPIQRDRSHDSLLQSPSSRSNVRTLSAGPRTMEITSFSPQNQVTFGKYTPNEIIAIVRVPELANRTPQSSQSSHTALRHVGSEPELNHRARQEEERGKLHYQRVHATSYNPPTSNQDYSARQSRSRAGPNDRSNDYSSPVTIHPRSSSTTPYYHPQTGQRRSGSLGNLLGANIEFEIEIEKRPPQQPEQPTTVALDQASRAIVTTSRDGRVSIQNVAARPGNTVVINSDFHSSDRSLNRSSGYFSSDELRSQGIPGNYSSDEQSSGAAATGQGILHQRRYKNNDQPSSRLPPHYRPKQQSTHYQQLNNENFDRVNQIVHRYYQQSNTQGFNEAIDQIDALYNNLDVHSNEEYFHDRLIPAGQNAAQTPITYDYTKPPTTNRRRELSQNNSEYAKRYTSTGFQNMSPPDDQNQNNSAIRHLVSPPTSMMPNEKRRSDLIDSHRAMSDNENLRQYNSNSRTWGSTSLNDLVTATPIRPSQSLSSSGILADYTTPGSMSPNSGFGSTQNVIVQQNRLNSQSQIVQRNRTSVKQMKQKSAAKKKFTSNTQGQYSDDDDNDSPLSDNGHPPVPTRFASYPYRHQ